ncbi:MULTISPECIES: glycoside hydrolase family 25 protein [Methylobacterium]|uniref:glycoside hydrolase family 25 protein n=1 Tax=Methylobacterium TaxID=407 RepID=UPI00104F7033|nr:MULTISPECIES: GH25 family lysozyme [Methylobacterium]MDR7038428.1 lysozyme [Methylobacterium sp. BE186]
MSQWNGTSLTADAPRGPLARWRAGAKRVLAAGLLASLAACAANTDFYPTKGDAKPHPGVARAKRHPVQGIDISRWQGPVDWASVRGAGTQFAFIKATEGGDHVDERFRENWDGAARAGVPRGAYHFVYWCRSAQDQMEWFKRNVPNDPSALPPVLDVEWNGHSQTCPRRLPKAQALGMIRFMLAEMERYTGKRPIIYTDITFHKDVLEDELPDYPHWVRSTAAEPEQRFANRKWMLWQFTSTGRVPGVRGDVDRNAFYGTPAEWASFLATDCDPREHRSLTAQGLCSGK